MKLLVRTLRQNPIFYLGYLIFAIILAVFCFAIPKSEGFLLVNHYHNRWLDSFFILFTNLGDGIFSIIIMVFMMIRRKFGWSLQIAVSFLVTGGLVQLIKQLVHSPRPQIYFGPQVIHFIHGITRTGYGSFPSGHAATVFALTTILSLYFPARKTVIFFLLMAVLTGFSRIYLSQHFPIDVLVGSAIGMMISTLTYVWIPLNESAPQSVKLR